METLRTECPRSPGWIFNDTRTKAIQLGCNTYSCPICGPRKIKRFKKALAKWINSQKITRIWTLTLTHDIPNQVTHFEILKIAWSNTLKDIRRLKRFEYQSKIQYIAIREPHKDGYIHLHVLVNCFIRVELLQELFDHHVRNQMLRFRGESEEHKSKYDELIKREKICNVQMERVYKPRGIINYLTKYLTKAIAHLPAWAKIRYSKSQFVLFEKRNPNGVWQFFPRIEDPTILDTNVDTFSKFHPDINAEILLSCLLMDRYGSLSPPDFNLKDYQNLLEYVQLIKETF